MMFVVFPSPLLAGEFTYAGGLLRSLVNLALCVVLSARDGLGDVVILAAVADAAALSALLLFMMVAACHDKARSAGLPSATSINAPIFGPCIGFVIFGVAAGVSVSKLSIASSALEFMLGVALWVTWWFLVRQKNVKPPLKSLAEMRHALRGATFALGLPLVVIVGLKFGVFTATEAVLAAAFCALVVWLFVDRWLKYSQLHAVFLKASRARGYRVFVGVSLGICLADLGGETAQLALLGRLTGLMGVPARWLTNCLWPVVRDRYAVHCPPLSAY